MSSNPIDQENPTRRIYAISLLGAAIAGVCILFIFAFIWFQPDQLSMSDRYFPSPTATATQTRTPTPTPNLTATQKVIRATSTSNAVQTTVAHIDNQWDVLIFDDFNSNKNDWGLSSSDEWAYIIRIINGVYRWDATSKKGFIYHMTADTKYVANFFLEVETQKIEGTSSSDSGLIFRHESGNNYYYFGIDNDSYHVSLHYNDEWITIIDWTESSAILSDLPNRLTVIGIASRFSFLINDQLVATATDNHIQQGTAGMAIQIHKANQRAIFEFDNFELIEP